MSTRVPNTYVALDDTMYAPDQPYSAMAVDAIAQGANRLIASASHVFCAPIPQRLQPNFGELQDYNAFTVPFNSKWVLWVPSFIVSKKPGSLRMDFRVSYNLEAGSVEYQVVTTQNPLRQQSSGPGYRYDDTTGERTLAVNSVPVSANPTERISLWGRAPTLGSSSARYTGGSGTTGTVWGAGLLSFLVVGPDSGGVPTALAWGTVPPDTFADAGYSIEIENANGEVVGTFRIIAVRAVSIIVDPGLGTTIQGRELLTDPTPPTYIQREINSAPTKYTFTIRTGTRVVLRCLAGATAEESPT